MNLRRWVLIIISSGLLSVFAPGQQEGNPSGAAFASNLPAFSAHDLPCAEVRQRYVGDALKVVIHPLVFIVEALSCRKWKALPALTFSPTG